MNNNNKTDQFQEHSIIRLLPSLFLCCGEIRVTWTQALWHFNSWSNNWDGKVPNGQVAHTVWVHWTKGWFIPFGMELDAWDLTVLPRIMCNLKVRNWLSRIFHLIVWFQSPTSGCGWLKLGSVKAGMWGNCCTSFCLLIEACSSHKGWRVLRIHLIFTLIGPNEILYHVIFLGLSNS